MRDARSECGVDLERLAQRFAMIANCRSTADRTTSLDMYPAKVIPDMNL